MLFPFSQTASYFRAPAQILVGMSVLFSLAASPLQAIDYAPGEIVTTDIEITPSGSTLPLVVASGEAEQRGDIFGTGSISKQGAGSLILSGDNTFDEGTTLEAGTLRLEGMSALGTGGLTIKAGTTLGNVNTGDVMFDNNSVFEGDFTIDVDGEVVDGNSQGSLENFGSVTLLTDTTITLTGDGLACFGGTITGTNLTFLASGTADAHVMFCSDTPNAITGLVRIGTGVSMELWKVGQTVSGGEEIPVVAISGNLQIDTGAEVILLNENQFAATSDVEVNGTLVGSTTLTNAIDALTGTGTITSDLGDTLAVNSGNFSGQITGDQAILKQGGGTLVLSGTSSYTAGTTITGGILRAQSAKALGTGSVNVSGGASLKVDAGVALDIGASNKITIANDGVTTYSKDFASGESLANFNTITSSGTDANEARILGGITSQTRTVEGTFATAPSTPASNDVYRISDVFSISGTGSDVFVMQLSYAQDSYNDAATAGLYTSELALVLGRLANGEWVSLGSGLFVEGAWSAEYTAVGTHGVDTTNNTVWAVTDQGGEISVVPEPSTWLLLGLGLAVVLHRFRRKVLQH